MKKSVELPLSEPFYSTYHNHAIAGAVLSANPSLRNWFLNEVMLLSCQTTFATSYFTTPRIRMNGSSWSDCPYLERIYYDIRYLGGYANYLIRNLLDNGYYVCFGGTDDFYIKGKSWYHKRHFDHDGMICGYDMLDKTFSVFAYDENWVCRKFKTPQRAFVRAMRSMQKRWRHGYIEAIRPTSVKLDFSPETALANIKDYLNSRFEGDTLYGIEVNKYAAAYADKLYNGEIPYEKADRRFVRMIWEHKRGMAERIRLIEAAYGKENFLSAEYEKLVKDADGLRVLYASYCLRRRDSILLTVRDGLSDIYFRENKILRHLLTF